MEMVLLFVCASTLALCFVVWYRKMEKEKLRAYTDFCVAHNHFEGWQRARPFLYAGQSRYARSLVFEMIDAYRRILAYDKGETDEGFIEVLLKLLDETPPPLPPSTETPACSRGLHFLRAPVYSSCT
ncbi:hypothetical protein A3D62_01285 [Candidatus Kaiserbacteria bacterium RIFCSPHIGHO2_02_FULL_49_11]|uniref:Uncharacterized protein n=1 Tax=Candidatus Kaiserbacteria bacterium RIFCSPHIGHO2_02_FULL_49_11 TaxID=1798489 RepID=A0A1F6D0G9_9BACT|nr:MAG: hypothetical protein A3D62_01285 [Candidatus Kaiserbacteria bacterium RIFCSPHIGHO2_02_FULL_49_11]